MNNKVLAAALMLAVAVLTTARPAEARRFGFNGLGGFANSGWHRGWGQNGGLMGNSGSCGMHRMGWGGNSAFNGGGFFGNRGSGFFGNRGSGLVGRDARLFNEQSRIQQALANPNISPSRASFLQNQLSRIQGRESSLGGLLGNRLTSQQSRIQQLLASGNLNPQQAARLQDRLTRLQNEQGALGTGNPFSNPSIWGRFGRNGY